jgi:hypothetical protein
VIHYKQMRASTKLKAELEPVPRTQAEFATRQQKRLAEAEGTTWPQAILKTEQVATTPFINFLRLQDVHANYVIDTEQALAGPNPSANRPGQNIFDPTYWDSVYAAHIQEIMRDKTYQYNRRLTEISDSPSFMLRLLWEDFATANAQEMDALKSSVDAVYAKFASYCSPGRAAGIHRQMQPQVTAHREQANKKRLAQETADHLECRRCVAWPTLTLPSVCAIYSVCGAPHAVLLCDRLLDENECALRRCRT